MPGANRILKVGRKRYHRRTPYRYVNVREHDWVNIHRLSDKLGLSIVDTIGLVVAENLKAHHVDPLTAEDLVRFEQTELNP